MHLKNVVDANVNLVSRIGNRWVDAASALENGTYDSKLLLRDVFASLVTDPLNWTNTVLQELQTPPAPQPPSDARK